LGYFSLKVKKKGGKALHEIEKNFSVLVMSTSIFWKTSFQTLRKPLDTESLQTEPLDQLKSLGTPKEWH